MNKTNLIRLATRITDEAEAYKYLEELRWGDNPTCPHCGAGNPCFLNPMNGVSRKTRTGAMSIRRVWKCRERSCRKQFSVLTDTVMHGTKIPVRVWVLVMFEMAASKNGVSAREIERKYGLTARSAWFLAHRIREAMMADPVAAPLTGTVVSDETYIGGSQRNRHASKRKSAPDKTPVMSLIGKDSGEVRSFVLPRVSAKSLGDVIASNLSRNAILHTDENPSYMEAARKLERHQTVNHRSGEYVRDGVSTNVAEGYFSQLKRSLDGTHHHVTVKHLHRYLAEFDYRYTTRRATDGERFIVMVRRAGGRRLTYKPLTGAA